MSWKKTFRNNVDYIFGGVNVVMGILVLTNMLGQLHAPAKDERGQKPWPQRIYMGTQIGIFLLLLFLAVLWILSGKAKASVPP